MTKNRNLNTRVNNLENQEPDEAPIIVIDWGSDPNHDNLKPGDKIIHWGLDDQITVEIVGKYDKA